MNQIFNYYEADIKRSMPLGTVTLGYVLNAIKNPKKDIRHVFEQIRIAEEAKDMATKNQLKTHLYSFTPCVRVEGARKYANIINFTGLLVLDFDHLEHSIAIEFKEYLFNEYKFIYSVWLSASRHGVRAIVNIPTCTSVDDYKGYFGGIEKKLEGYNGFDSAPKNCILPMFISYDADILVRESPDQWTGKYVKLVPPPVKQYIVDDKTSSIEKIIAKKIIPITDNGHPQLRAAAYLMGGYTGAGYIERDVAISILHHLIDTNAYLSQKAEVYKKTAIQMVDSGINTPTYLSKP
jgi:hypothetical protein